MKEAAQCAALIRKELKAQFPSITFSVRSDNYAGGNAVRISYTNGVPTEKVNAIVNKYQDGDFDGMTDMYNYRNNDDNLPRAKYVQVSRDIDETIREATKKEIAEKYGITDPADETQWHQKFQAWSDQVVWRELATRTF